MNVSSADAKPDIRVTTYDGPGAEPVMREVPWPHVPPKAALIRIAACGVCGTDQHILRGHWPKPPALAVHARPRTGGASSSRSARSSRPTTWASRLELGSRIMIPPLMPCGLCDWCKHYPETANKCLTPVYYGRYLGFNKPPHLWGGWAEYVYVDLGELPGTKIYKLPDDMSLLLGSLSEPLTSCIRAFNRAAKAGRLPLERYGRDPGHWPDRHSGHRRGLRNGRRAGDLGRCA